MSKILHCGSYSAGHDVHPIQALKAANAFVREPDKKVEAEIVEVDGFRIRLRTADGTDLDLYHHDPNEVVGLIEEYGPQVVHQPNWSILRFDNRLMSVSRNESAWQPCETAPLGGFFGRP